jgi:hypothetical protein
VCGGRVTPRRVRDTKRIALTRESRPPNSRRWSVDDVATLRRLAWTLTATQIALILGRTVLAVRTKAAHTRIRLRAEG